MQLIGLAKPEHAPIIADFQLRMAMETEGIKLNAQLVEQAVNYFLSLKSGDKFCDLGFYLVKSVKEEVVGSLLITFETSKKWWIQSVYVKQAHRRHGHFTSLFQKAVQLARENEAESIKLYAQSNNDRAKATYFKLGMHVIEGKFYSYDFVLGNPTNQSSNHLILSRAESNEGILAWKQQRKNALEIKISNHLGELIEIEREKIRIGVFSYFQQFSDWRFGIMRYVQQLYLAEGVTLEEVVPAIISYLVGNSKIKVAAIRFIASETVVAQLKGGHLEHYDILAIYLK